MWKKYVLLMLLLISTGCVNQNKKIAEENLEKGQIMCLRNKCSESIKYFTEAIEKDPESPKAHYLTGLIYEKTNRINKAVDEYKKTLELKKDYDDANESLVVAYVKLGQKDQAKAQIQKFVTENPQKASGHVLLAQMNLIDKNAAKSRENLQKAIELDPNNTEALITMGSLNLQEKKFDEAIKNLQKVVELEPENMDAMLSLADIYLQQKNFGDAKAIYEKINKQDPNVPKAHFNLGIIYTMQNSFDKAKQEFIKVTEISPMFIEAHYYLVLIYSKTGEKALRDKELAKISALNPDLAKQLKAQLKGK